MSSDKWWRRRRRKESESPWSFTRQNKSEIWHPSCQYPWEVLPRNTAWKPAKICDFGKFHPIIMSYWLHNHGLLRLTFYLFLYLFMHYALVSWRKFCFVVFNHLMLLDLPELILSYAFFPAGACTVICCYVRLCHPHLGWQRRKSYWFFSTEKGTKNLTTSHCAGFISDIFSQCLYCCTA